MVEWINGQTAGPQIFAFGPANPPEKSCSPNDLRSEREILLADSETVNKHDSCQKRH